MNAMKFKPGLLALILASFLSSGCALLPMLLGGLGGAGLTLSGEEESAMFMAGDTPASAPYQVRTSNSRLEAPDGGKIYGSY